jgi:hypothetical protein
MKRVLAGFLLATVMGCQAANPLIGVWEGSLMGQKLEMTFTADGKFTQSVTVGPAKVAGSGTWSSEGDKVTLNPTGYSVEGAEGAMKALIEAEAKKQMGAPQTATFRSRATSFRSRATAAIWK